MNKVNTTASVVTLIKTSLKIVSLYAEYYSHIKNTKKDAKRLCLEIRVFINILQNLDKLARNPEVIKLFASKLFSDDIRQYLIYLERLQKKLEPEKNRKIINRCEIRALKWSFKSKKLEKDLDIFEKYKSIFTAALNTN